MIQENEIYQLENSTSFTVLENGTITTPKGFISGGLHCGIKKKKLDLGWIYSKSPTSAAAVYTTNTFIAAPLTVTKESIEVAHQIRGVIVNSGVANACTGDRGLVDAYVMRKAFADKVGLPEHEVAISSTGVIGSHLPMDKLKDGIQNITLTNDQPFTFEQAILTTDTCMKYLAVQVVIDGKKVTIGGAAKGSGMIHPNMATMLSFVTTDANIGHEALHQLLKTSTNQTFNMITVDGDTSTNDMVLVMANGEAHNEELQALHPQWNVFAKAFNFVCESLAKKIARDGEGATKLVEVEVSGAESDLAASIVAKSIVGSNLVKTAIHGADANWGRIVCAVGYSGQYVNHQTVSVKLGDIQVVEEGLPCSFNEEKAKEYLQQENVKIVVELNQGSSSAIAWGCDLSYDYVRINASYRT